MARLVTATESLTSLKWGGAVGTKNVWGGGDRGLLQEITMFSAEKDKIWYLQHRL